MTCHDDISTDDDNDNDDADIEGNGNKKNKNSVKLNILDEDATPTPSESLCSSPSSLNCGSLAVTPVHHPKTDIDLCFNDGEKSVPAKA